MRCSPKESSAVICGVSCRGRWVGLYQTVRRHWPEDINALFTALSTLNLVKMEWFRKGRLFVCVTETDRQTDRRTVTTALHSVGYCGPCPLPRCHFCPAGYIGYCWLLCWLLVTMVTTDLWLLVILLAVMFSIGCSVYWRSFWLLWLPCYCSYCCLL